MLKAIESDLYRISKDEDYEDDVYRVEIKETGKYIVIFKDELNELIDLLTKTKEIL